VATNLTKGKTTKTAQPRTVKPTDAEIVAAIAAAMKPGPAPAEIDPMQAAVGAAAAPAKTRRTAPATPLHKFPVMPEEAFGGELLLTNVMQAKALGRCDVAREQVVMTHDQYGVISLRAVEYDGGYLIGLIDQDRATYCECEWYATVNEMNEAWPEWLEAAAL